MAHRIEGITPGGIAEEVGIRPGERLLSINGEEVIDQIDYQYLSSGERLLLAVQGADGITEYDIEKEPGEPLGITLADTLMSRPRLCANHCVFCFIDQMPPGLRNTLYVKDDDWRLSLMMGNFITLTNLSDREFDRIIARRASPLYISVHATDGAVRKRMMGNPRAGRLLSQLRRLKEAGIEFHAQIVLCPGINDGAVLDDTLGTLAALWPNARSAALVPVGLTGHREGLCRLKPYDKASAAALLAQAEAWQEKLIKGLGTRFVFPADEFYCLSGHPLPLEEAYEGFPQIENGVGLLRMFQLAYEGAYRLEDFSAVKPRRVRIATGVSAAPFLRELLARMPVPGVSVTVQACENSFFGPNVTVAGLLTGRDLRAELGGPVDADVLLISRDMLRHEGDRLLDDDTLAALSEGLGIPVQAVPSDGAAFLDALTGYGAQDAWED